MDTKTSRSMYCLQENHFRTKDIHTLTESEKMEKIVFQANGNERKEG